MSLIQFTRRLVTFLTVMLLLAFMFCFLRLPSVKADISDTRTFTTSTSDGRATGINGDYPTARTQTSASEYSQAQSNFAVGQYKIGALYYVDRVYLYFDTSAIPEAANITSAILSVYVYANQSVTDFNVTIQSGQPTYPHDPFQDNDYYYNYYSGNGGSRNTTEITALGYWNITLSATGLTWINTDETVTRFCLRSSNDISASAPSGSQYLGIYSREQGSDYAAKLYVSYTVETEDFYNYNIYGPYVDSPTGTVLNGYVNVTVYPNYNETYSFQLNGTAGVDNATLYFEQQPLMMVWNVSTSGNYSRVIYFTDAVAEDIYVFVPNPDYPFYYYSFNIIDLHGISDGFLESRVYLDGAYRVVERQTTSSINTLQFIMQWSVIYRMRVVADQGTYSSGDFTALNEGSQNIIIPYGAFPTETYGSDVYVNAARLNSTLIQMNYTDNTETTAWVNLLITHRVGSTDVTDYSENNTDTTVQVNWNSADNATDYKATVTAYRDGVTYTYKFACQLPPNAANPFAFLGAPYSYAVAIVLTLAAGLVFSYATKVGGAWAMVCLAGIFTWIGWLPQNTTTYGILGFAGLIAGLLTIAEWKKTEREL